MDWIDAPALSYKLVCDAGTVLSNRMVTARRQHDCVICRGPIARGDRVRREARRDTQGILVSLYVCTECCNALRTGECDNAIDEVYGASLRARRAEATR